MRFVAAILGLSFLLVAPALAAPEDHPASVYTGAGYVHGAAADDYFAGGRRHVVSRYNSDIAPSSVRRVARVRHHRSDNPRVVADTGCSPLRPLLCPGIDLAFDKGWHPAEILKRIAEAAARVVIDVVSLPQKVFQFFIDRGYPHVAAAGIAGHIRAESNFNVRDTGDGGLARGLAQWHPDRYALCKRIARESGRDLYDFDLQLECIDRELRESETLARTELLKAKDVDDATVAFAHFERPFGYSPGAPRRTHDFRYRFQQATRYFEEFKHLQPRTVESAI